LPGDYDKTLSQYTKENYARLSSTSSWLYGVIGLLSGILILSAAILVAVLLFVSKKDMSSFPILPSFFSKEFENKLKRPVAVYGERVPNEVLTVVIDSDEELNSSSDEDNDNDDDEESDSESSSTELSQRGFKAPKIPKLSLPTRKGNQYYNAPNTDSDEDDFKDDKEIDDLLNDDDDDESVLPSKFSSDDYINEAVSNEKDVFTQIPSDPDVSYFHPTARLLTKIGRKISVSQSALTHRLGNMIGLKVETYDTEEDPKDSSSEPLSTSAHLPANEPVQNNFKLSLPQAVPDEILQTRTRNSLFARLSLTLAPLLSSRDDKPEENQQDSNSNLRRAKERSKLKNENFDDNEESEL
jgi:hypothetical protein